MRVLGGARLCQELRENRGRVRQIVRVHALEHIAAHELFLRVADHARQGGTGVACRAVGGDEDHDVKAVFDDGTEPVLRLLNARVFQGELALEFPPLHLTELLGLVFDLLAFLKELDKADHLGAQNRRHQRLDQVIHGAERVCLLQLHPIGLKGGEEDDRRILAVFAPANPLGRFKPVQALHVDIEQDDGKFALLHEAEGFLPGPGKHQLVAQVIENRFQGQQIFALVIDQQDVGPGFGGRDRCHVPSALALARKRSPAVPLAYLLAAIHSSGRTWQYRRQSLPGPFP